LAINLITKCHECSSVFNLSHYFYSFFCGDSSDSEMNLFDYLLQVAANRLGYTVMNVGQLKID
jgi:hypothetical protein